MKGLGDLMKQAKQMQDNMQKMQEDLANVEVQGESGAGLVKVTMNGRHGVKGIEIDTSLMSEDKEILEDLLAAAVNDAVHKVEDANKTKLGDLTSGMNIPDGFKMPF